MSSDGLIVKYKKIQDSIDVSQSDNSHIYQAMFQHLPFGIIYRNRKGDVEYINPAGRNLIGISNKEIQNFDVRRLSIEVLDSNGIRLPERDFPGALTLKEGKPQKDVIIGIRKDHTTIWIKANSEIIVDNTSDQILGVVTSIVDITQERDASVILQAQTKRAQMAVESAQMGIWDWIPEKQEMIWDKKLFQIYGYADEKAVAPSDAWEKAVHPDDADRVRNESYDMIKNACNKEIDYRAVWPNGDIRHLRSQARIIKGSHGEVKRVIGVTHDITNAVMAEKKLWELAYIDPLTRCFSRAGLNFRLSRSVARALRKNDTFSVLMIGLRRFKDVNENYGLSVGDKVLIEISRRLQDIVEECDTVARIAGDEFMLVLESVGSADAIEVFVDKVYSKALAPIQLNQDLTVNLDAAMGVSSFPQDGCDAATLQTHSSLAMHHPKNTETRKFISYCNEMSEEVSRKFSLKYQLMSAVKNEEFQLYYQPIIDLDRHTVIGCEALIRWKDNTSKFISPMEFIPVVEESGLIHELGNWINLTAIKQWELWQHLTPDLKYISVNVSPRQLEHSCFVEDLMAMVSAHSISPENLQLEITEGTFLKESLNADSMLHRLAEYGFRLAIDDFGTGYSSLAYLKRFNVDVIKIDRSFIVDIETDQSDRDIVSAILAMNKKLGFRTLVEGVETQKQDKIIHGLGCESAQGYLYGKPTFADEFAEIYISSKVSS